MFPKVGSLPLMRGHKYCYSVRGQLFNEIPEMLAGNRINAGGRVVQKENVGLVQKRAAQSQALTPAGRQFPVVAIAHFLQARHIQNPIDAFGPLILRNIINAQIKTQIFERCQIFIKRKFLRHVTDRMFDFFRFGHNVVAGDKARTGGRSNNAAKHADGRGFAGAVGAQEAEDFPFLYGESDFVDGDKRAEFLFQIVTVMESEVESVIDKPLIHFLYLVRSLLLPES